MTALKPDTTGYRAHLSEDIAAGPSYGEVDRFLVFLEQLDVACDLLLGGTLAKARAAMVGIDNLANLLLHVHAQRVFASGEQSRRHPRKRYNNKERKKILGDFGRMVSLASKTADGTSWRRQADILDDLDAAVMRVGHTYRNGIYHEDRHNAALLLPLVVLYAQALGRAFCRHHSHGISYSVTGEQSARLAALGYEPHVDSFIPSRQMLDFAAAAKEITEGLAGRLQVEDHALPLWLSGDIVDRCARCSRVIAGLMEDGMPAERMNVIFGWTQFLATHGADERWLKLEDARDQLCEELLGVPADGDERDAAVAACERAEAAYVARAHELQASFSVAVGPSDSLRLAKAGERLADAKDIGALLARYRQIDLEVDQLENATMEAVTAWDQIVEEGVDRARESR